SLVILTEDVTEEVLNLITNIEKINKESSLLLFYISYIKDKKIKDLSLSEKQNSHFENIIKDTSVENKIENIKLYMKNIWYNEHKDFFWYNSHLRKTNTYRGYWAFEVAALIKMIGLDGNIFKDLDYFPSDF
ncbi:MAG TPA: DUF1911 domain-containing protein, partial [Spirochaetota bacterium]|nr:DUF1911 domain-containing protein [Spirochaetota bacterium]